MQRRSFPKWLIVLDLLYAGLLLLVKVGLKSLMKLLVKSTKAKTAIKIQQAILKVGAYLGRTEIIIAVIAVNVLVLLFSMMRKRGAGLKNGTAQPIVINNQGGTSNSAIPTGGSSLSSDTSDKTMNLF